MLMVRLGRQDLRQRMQNEPSDDSGNPLYVATNGFDIMFLLARRFHSRPHLIQGIIFFYSGGQCCPLRLRFLVGVRELEAELEAPAEPVPAALDEDSMTITSVDGRDFPVSRSIRTISDRPL